LPPPALFNLGSKPGNHSFIKPDCNSRFAFENHIHVSFCLFASPVLAGVNNRESAAQAI
jgi:hypothetical protein